MTFFPENSLILYKMRLYLIFWDKITGGMKFESVYFFGKFRMYRYYFGRFIISVCVFERLVWPYCSYILNLEHGINWLHGWHSGLVISFLRYEPRVESPHGTNIYMAIVFKTMYGMQIDVLGLSVYPPLSEKKKKSSCEKFYQKILQNYFSRCENFRWVS